jgi:hypothetical protein
MRGANATPNVSLKRRATAGGRMRYSDGLEVRLGDTVSVPVPTGESLARVVMLGNSHEHL